MPRLRRLPACSSARDFATRDMKELSMPRPAFARAAGFRAEGVGSVPKAQVIGFRVAGKTGTAHKPERGGYAKNKYVASFVGFAPAEKPRFVIAVMVDEPSAGKHYGGEVAAPIFSQIANDTLRRMQLSPDPALRIFPAVALIAEGTQ